MLNTINEVNTENSLNSLDDDDINSKEFMFDKYKSTLCKFPLLEKKQKKKKSKY